MVTAASTATKEAEQDAGGGGWNWMDRLCIAGGEPVARRGVRRLGIQVRASACIAIADGDAKRGLEQPPARSVTPLWRANSSHTSKLPMENITTWRARSMSPRQRQPVCHIQKQELESGARSRVGYALATRSDSRRFDTGMAGDGVRFRTEARSMAGASAQVDLPDDEWHTATCS